MAYVRDIYQLTADTDIQRIENHSSGRPIYIGRAAPGTAEGTSRWQIRKITYDGNDFASQVDFAGGSPAYSVSWTDRATYTYS